MGSLCSCLCGRWKPSLNCHSAADILSLRDPHLEEIGQKVRELELDSSLTASCLMFCHLEWLRHAWCILMQRFLVVWGRGDLPWLAHTCPEEVVKAQSTAEVMPEVILHVKPSKDSALAFIWEDKMLLIENWTCYIVSPKSRWVVPNPVHGQELCRFLEVGKALSLKTLIGKAGGTVFSFWLVD